MSFVVLTQLTRVAAVATCERLATLGIEAQILDQPNLFTKGSTGGMYRVRVAVDEQDLERAQAELARWEVEAAPRVASLARELRPQFLLGSLPALVLLGLILGGVLGGKWIAVALGLWFGGVVAVMAWHRWRGASGRAPSDG
jgi:hypothetical protein